MDTKISAGLRTLFLVHFIMALVFGLAFLLVPVQWLGLLKIPVADDMPFRLVGAAMLALAASSWLSYNADLWGQVKIVIQLEIVWTVIGSLVMLYGLLFAGQPPAEWINFVILAGFAAAFSYYYSRK